MHCPCGTPIMSFSTATISAYSPAIENKEGAAQGLLTGESINRDMGVVANYATFSLGEVRPFDCGASHHVSEVATQIWCFQGLFRQPMSWGQGGTTVWTPRKGLYLAAQYLVKTF